MEESIPPVPTDDPSRSVVAQWDPQAKKVAYFITHGHLFGQTCAVNSFNAVAKFLTCSARRLFACCGGNYFDDHIVSEPSFADSSGIGLLRRRLDFVRRGGTAFAFMAAGRGHRRGRQKGATQGQPQRHRQNRRKLRESGLGASRSLRGETAVCLSSDLVKRDCISHSWKEGFGHRARACVCF